MNDPDALAASKAEDYGYAHPWDRKGKGKQRDVDEDVVMGNPDEEEDEDIYESE